MRESLDSEKGTPLWQLVNELGEVTQKNREGFDPKIHVPIAQEIVEIIDNNLKFSGYLRLSLIVDDEIKGTIGEDVIRIGSYILWKSKKFFRKNILIIEPFWDRDIECLFGREEPYTEISYKRRNKQIESINVIVPDEFEGKEIGFVQYIRHPNSKNINLWRKS